jgi:hypothetical protein
LLWKFQFIGIKEPTNMTCHSRHVGALTHVFA